MTAKQTRKRLASHLPPVVLPPKQPVAVSEPEEASAQRPKAGPGQVFTREFIDAGSGHAKRFRNVGNSPLMLAFYRGWLVSPPDSVVPVGARVSADERYAAGEEFEKLWYVLHRTGMRDSTIEGISGNTGLFLTEAKEAAGKRVRAIEARMQASNYRIVAHFCGEGLSMAESVRLAGVDCSARAVACRIRESLDNLVYVTRGDACTRRRSRDATATTHSAPLQPFLQDHA